MIALGLEGGDVIGRAGYNVTGGYQNAPVFGPYPQVRYDVRVDRRVGDPPHLPLWIRYVFRGRMRSDCGEEKVACIRGTEEAYYEGEPAYSVSMEFFRVQ